MEIMKLIAQLFGRKDSLTPLPSRQIPEAIAPPEPEPIVELHAAKQGRYPGLSGNAHQRRIARRAQGG
jgi:hypothetical protein